MIAEFLQAWKSEVVGALKPEVQEFDRRKDRLVTMPDGKTTVVPADKPDLAHIAGNLETVRLLVEASGGEVWFDRNGVTLIFDPKEYRRNRAKMSLELSAEILRLREIARKPLDQAAILKMLRNDFRVCEFAQTIQTLRNVKFEINQTGEMSVERTKTSIGKSQLAKIYGLDALQEELTFTIPVFASKSRQYFNVSAALDPDPETKTFSITPYPGQLDNAIEAAEMALGDELRAKLPEGTPVFYGQP